MKCPIMNKTLKLLLPIILLFFCFSASGSEPDWLEKKGEHFIVYFNGDEKFAQDVLNEAERYYRNIASDLGYARYSEFWTWDKRVKIYIYPDHDSFIKATGQPGWSQGVANYNTKQITSYVWSSGFLDSLLPHEIAHLVFRDFVGFQGEVPLWLDEGVAQWEEDAKRPNAKALIKRYYSEDNLLSVEDIMKLDIRTLKDKEGLFIRPTTTKEKKAGVVFLSANNLIEVFYLESFSLVGYLIEKFGSDAFAGFCRELRDGKRIEDALSAAYPSHIRSISEFETGWREYLANS